MNIPLNQIYNFLDGLIDCNSIIYRFLPHGSRNLEDLTALKNHAIGDVKMTHRDWMNSFTVIMHDQEPLNFDFYNEQYINSTIDHWVKDNSPGLQSVLETPSIRNKWIKLNLGIIRYSTTLYDKNIICHSEKESPEIAKYETVGLIGVYWWSHAVIARDWYRYAEVDPALTNLPSQYANDFNIYNRAWSGTREYRLKFADLVIEHELVNASNIKFNQHDSGVHYTNHSYKNSMFVPKNNLALLPHNDAGSADSASYSTSDYQDCWFDVVLETLFDDPRLHLTEKILRPIACGKPFLLAGTKGSLEYLRSYEFKTFGNLIDESYDLETDPVLRLEKLVSTMKYIHSLSHKQKQELQKELTAITTHNKTRFFSRDFFNFVVEEFKTNYATAYDICAKNKLGNNWLNYRKEANKIPKLKKLISSDNAYRSRKDIANTIKECRGLRSC